MVCKTWNTTRRLECNDCKSIQEITGSEHVGVYKIRQHTVVVKTEASSYSSLTQTTVLRGAFKNEPDVRKEFIDNVKSAGVCTIAY